MAHLNALPYQLITDQATWLPVLERLQRETTIAIDLESNSMFAYREEVCLIQISITGNDYIVDPLADMDLSGLGDIVMNPAVEKIFHAAEYDLILLNRQYGWDLANLFDTMWAARILGYERFGLANVLELKFDVKLDKRYQRSDWSARPLSDDQLRYAQHDTHFLIRLRAMLAEELTERGCWLEAQEIFAEQSIVRLPDSEFDPDSFWSLTGVRDLTPPSQATLRDLHIFRDSEASRRKRPPFKIFGNKAMVNIARSRPRSMAGLGVINGLSPRLVSRYGRPILDIVRSHDQGSRPPKRPRRPRIPDAVYQRYDALHRWRKERARARGVESDVVISRDALWSLAYANPVSMAELSGVDGVGPVRREMYGAELLDLLAQQ